MLAPDPAPAQSRPYTTIEACRSCGSRSLRGILSFGETPLADALLNRDDLDRPELFVPLDLVFCKECSLVQIRQTVQPAILFGREYPYFSSVSPSLLAHFSTSARSLIERYGLGPNSLVIEAASNDGYMLKVFQDNGVPVLGIDPASGPARQAQQNGVDTINDFFTAELADALCKAGIRADLFLANNVLAHVADLNGFVTGIATLLRTSGVAVIECPYVVDLIEHGEFDTIYHQHLCYFSVHALDGLFRRHGLFLNRIERTAIHGESLRLFVSPVEAVDDSVRTLLSDEAAAGATGFEYYRYFADCVERQRVELIALLHSLRDAGKRIAAYGAAAKATTLMAYFGIDGSLIDYVADLNPFKVGKYMGGNHLPIVSPQHLLSDQPDYVLILAWNFAAEIMKQLRPYHDERGKFIIPIPDLRIV